MQIESIKELTPIYPPETLPARSGVYWAQSVDPETGDTASEWGFAYFDTTDRVWGCIADTVDHAAAHPEYEFAAQNKRWRGLTEDVPA
jgi:hypothetical protein